MRQDVLKRGKKGTVPPPVPPPVKPKSAPKPVSEPKDQGIWSDDPDIRHARARTMWETIARDYPAEPMDKISSLVCGYLNSNNYAGIAEVRAAVSQKIGQHHA
jgi:hypothetical protein